MAVAAIGAAFNSLTIQVLVEFGIQNSLRECLLQVVKQAVLCKNLVRIAAGKQLVQKFFLDSDVMILLFPSFLHRPGYRGQRRVLHLRDNKGQALSYVYYESEPGRRTAARITHP